MRTQRSFVALASLVASMLASEAGVLAQRQPFTTPWGHPDLQGIWNNQTPVPFERPEELGNKAFFTREEAAEFERTNVKRLLDATAASDPTSACVGREAGCIESLAVWMDDSKVSPNRRTSLVIDPQDGRIPYTREGRHRWLSVPSFAREILGKPTTQTARRTVP